MFTCVCGVYRQCDEESSLILGVLGIIPERLIGEELAADYILFLLNKNKIFNYVKILGLQEPSNDIYEVRRLSLNPTKP